MIMAESFREREKGVREPCEAQPKDKADVACDAKMIETNVVSDHVEKSGARDLAKNESEKVLSNVEFVDSTKCGMQDHQRSWRDVAKQGMMKNGSL